MFVGLAASQMFRSARPTNLSAGDELARMTQAEWHRYKTQAAPMIERLQGMTRDTSITDRAYGDVAKLGDSTQQAVDMSLGRRTRGMSPAQKRNLQAKMASTVALDKTSALNQAYMDQRDVRQGAVNDISNIANQLSGSALNTMTNVSGAQYARAMEESRARQARRSGITSLLGTATGGFLGGGF